MLLMFSVCMCVNAATLMVPNGDYSFSPLEVEGQCVQCVAQGYEEGCSCSEFQSQVPPPGR